MKGYAPGWQVRCRKCGLTFDAADLGIVRIGAAGTNYALRWCQQCRRLRWVAVERRPADLPEHAGPRCNRATHVRASAAGCDANAWGAAVSRTNVFLRFLRF